MTAETLRLSDGRRVRWWEGGDPEGLPVLFSHGCPDTRRAAWSGAEAARRQGVRLIAANRPGYAGSDVHASDHLSVAGDLAEIAARLAEVSVDEGVELVRPDFETGLARLTIDDADGALAARLRTGPAPR